jgi:hypothetical protein
VALVISGKDQGAIRSATGGWTLDGLRTDSANLGGLGAIERHGKQRVARRRFRDRARQAGPIRHRASTWVDLLNVKLSYERAVGLGVS